MISVNLESLAKDYINDVEKVCYLILQAYNLKSKKDLINQRAIQDVGEFYLNGKKNNYTFHGRGCRFSNNELEIDWDFGYKDIWCGLDPWKLFYYIRDNKKDNEFSDGYQIQKMFDELVINRKMKKKLNLYYFT